MVTVRDVKLIKDVALSHVLSRDQIITLGYFESISRANRRLAALVHARFLKVLDTPYHSQHLYIAGVRAHEVVGERIHALLVVRPPSPRYLQHALAVTNVRIALVKRGWTDWRFEQQIRDSVHIGDKIYEIRADGLIVGKYGPVFIEADMGHVSRRNFARKTDGYERYAKSGRHKEIFKMEDLKVLVVTTGSLRLIHLSEQCKRTTHVSFRFITFEDLGATMPGGWS